MKASILNPLSTVSSFFNDYEIESVHYYDLDDSEIEEDTFDGCVNGCFAEIEITEKDQSAKEFQE